MTVETSVMHQRLPGAATMNVRYRVTLDMSKRVQLVSMVLGGKAAVRKLARAQILRAADAGSTDEEIARLHWPSGGALQGSVRPLPSRSC